MLANDEDSICHSQLAFEYYLELSPVKVSTVVCDHRSFLWRLSAAFVACVTDRLRRDLM